MPGSPFTFEIVGLASALQVARFEGWEELSGLFELEITLLTEDAALDLADLVGKKACLTIVSEDGSRYMHGLVFRIAQTEQGKNLTAYSVTLASIATPLTLGADHRIFQDVSGPEAAEKVLKAAGLTRGDDYRLSLQETHAAREYSVQYGESDWAFVSRIFEEEGIYTYIEHTDAKGVLVACDTSSAVAPPIDGDATLLFREPTGALLLGEHVSRFRVSEGMRPGKVTVRDYNFKKPALLLEAETAASRWTNREVYAYPGDYEAPADGDAIAAWRLQGWQAGKRIAWGTSATPRLAPGHKFTLAEHPREDFNIEWLVTRVEHSGREPALTSGDAGETTRYENRFECIPSSVPFRPPLATPKPRIRGIQTAIVTGPSGEEIHTDEYGRIKVQFHWDRLGKKDDKSSCWIRVAQLWAGAGWGGTFIPRIGHEVIIEFLEGDPDRPIVVGRVHHGTNVPPYTLPSEKTKSTIKSNSSPGGEGSNELRFEDKKNSEEIYLHGQKDWTIAIENDKNQTIGHDETLKVGNNRTKEIAVDQKEKVGGDDTIAVTGNRAETIDGSESLTVAKDAKRKIGGDQSVEIGKAAQVQIGKTLEASIAGDQTVTVGGAQSLSVTKDQTESVGKDKKTEVSGGFTLTVTKDIASKTDADHTEEVGKNRMFVAGEKLAIECGDAKVTILKNGNITIEGKDVTIKGSGPVKIQGSKIDVKSDGAVNVEASGAVKVKGSTVGVN